MYLLFISLFKLNATRFFYSLHFIHLHPKEEPKMTLKHLRIFAEVCRMESITEAAKNSEYGTACCQQCHPRIRSPFYQVKLFERMNRRLYITNAGEYLRGYADSILTQFEESRDILQDIAASTRIRIGSNVSFRSQLSAEDYFRFPVDPPGDPSFSP